jgi:hypothetical protein
MSSDNAFIKARKNASEDSLKVLNKNKKKDEIPDDFDLPLPPSTPISVNEDEKNVNKLLKRVDTLLKTLARKRKINGGVRRITHKRKNKNKFKNKSKKNA